MSSWVQRTRTLAEWIGLGVLVGLACGAASALFLLLLDWATETRGSEPRLIYALPVAGLLIGAVYERLGASIKGGNNLIIDTLHDDGPTIPLRMAPMVLIGTVLTHLFGGSAGREGTAVQMGASLADQLAHHLRLSRTVRLQLLAAGIAGGFASVFGTPLAGTVFGLELVLLGRLEYHALVPALVAAVVGDLTTRSLGIEHTPYPLVQALSLTPLVLAKWLVFALLVAAVTVTFIELTHRLKAFLERWIPRLPLRMAFGGAAIVALWRLFGTDDYLGLGVPTIVRAFSDGELPAYAFAAKLLFTAVTLSAGFLGGEVTPLFFVGATLGNVLGRALELPLGLSAGVGLAAVFGAAANTPLALSIMAVELLGAPVLPHVAIVVVVAYLLTGHRGIYPSQRLWRAKAGGDPLAKPTRLRDLG
ncbi:MAG: chloride channel protein [Deltaproteobacteria bacterium]|nr:chloride channel protein [Deltaproteobacteria bacterium]